MREAWNSPCRCKAGNPAGREGQIIDRKNILEMEGGRDMAWIIGAAVFIILFLAAIYVVAGIAVSVAGSYQTD